MKKTYEFKPLCLLVLIFDLILSISMWRLSAMIQDFWDLMSSMSRLVNVLIFYMVGILGIIVVTVFLYIYYLKKEKNQGILWDAILHTLFSMFFIFQLMNVDALHGMNINQLTMIIDFFVFVSALLHIFIMVRLEGLIEMTLLDRYLPAGKKESQVIQTQTVGSLVDDLKEVIHKPKFTKEKVITFVKSKNGRIIIAVAGIIVVVFTGYKIWDTFFNKTVIDVFTHMQVIYEGYNGEGRAEVDEYSIDYDMTDENLGQFVDNITFNIENNGKLSNGDQVTVKAIYSKETAKQLKVVLKEETQIFEVSGLTVKYQSAQEIDQDVYQRAYEKAIEKSKEVSYFGDETIKTFYKAYYVIDDSKTISYQDNYLVFVFSEVYQDFDWQTYQNIEKTRYICYYTSVDSSYDSEEAYMYKSYLYDESYDYISDESKILLGLQGLSLTHSEEPKIEEMNHSVNQI